VVHSLKVLDPKRPIREADIPRCGKKRCYDHLVGGDKQRLWGGQTRLRVHRIQTAWLTLSLGTVTTLGEGQESESAGCDARGGGGLSAHLKVAVARASGANVTAPRGKKRRPYLNSCGGSHHLFLYLSLMAVHVLCCITRQLAH
jgi:hypothetical protein